MILYHYYGILAYLIILVFGDPNNECLKIDTCKCVRSLDSATIDLTTLTSITSIDDDYVPWAYNPCKAVQCHQAKSMALCKNYDEGFGNLSSSTFIDTGYEIMIKYTTKNVNCKNDRVSIVKLICGSNLPNKLKADKTNLPCTANFSLTTNLACIPSLLTTSVSTSSPVQSTTVFTTQEPSSESTTQAIEVSSVKFSTQSSFTQSLTSSEFQSEVAPSTTTLVSVQSSYSIPPITTYKDLSFMTTTELYKTSSLSESTLSPTQSLETLSSNTIKSTSSSSTSSSSTSYSSTSSSSASTSSASSSPLESCIDKLWLICGICASVIFGFIVGYVIKQYPRERSDTLKLVDNYSLEDL